MLSRRAVHAADVARRLVARPIVQPPLTSSLAIVVSAQRPSTPVQDAAVALVSELVARGTDAVETVASRRPSP